MFDFVRKHMKLLMTVMMLLIIPSFILVGINGFDRAGERSATVAQVDGRSITQQEWDAAHRVEVDRLRSSMPSLDPQLLDSPEAKYATLERLVRDRVVEAAAKKMHLTASDQRLARDLRDNPTIAALRKPDGTLDIERYKQLVGSQGMTPEMFEARVRNDIALRQVLAGVTGSGLTVPSVADVSLNAYFERREVQVARFNTSDFAAKVSLTDAQVEQYYKDNPAMFQAPEQANAEYVVLDLDSIRKTVTPSAEEVKTYFEQNAGRFGAQEERRASHILINAPKSASESERQKAKAKADELLVQVKKSPESFAEVAKKNSQDPGSAVNGGDLDFFAKGAMVKPFEEAAFSLSKGDISPVVETEFGHHIIRLTDVKAPKQKSFEEMRPEIETELKKQQAQKKYAEVAEVFTNAVYEQSDSLKPIAERLKLEVKTINNIVRNPPKEAAGVWNNPKFVKALFSPDSIDKKRNTEAVEIAANQLVSGRILQYTPARTLPFAEVKDRARERAMAAQGAELARKEGAEKLTTWKATPAAAVLPDAVAVSRGQAQQLPPQVVEAAMRADPATMPAWIGVDLAAQGYAVVKVNKVLERDVSRTQNAQQDRNQYTQWWSAAESAAYYNTLKEKFKVQIKVTKPLPKKDEASEQS